MIVVHIGMPKSGSTTIQNFLAQNDDALRRLSVDYPRLGREWTSHTNAHHNFANEVAGATSRTNAKSARMADLAPYVSKADYCHTILSSERFCQLSEPSIAEFGKIIISLRQDVRVVLIIRDLLDQVPSAYAQSVRFGYQTKDFDEYFKVKSGFERASHLDVARRWAGVFGWDAIRVRTLQASELRGGDLIEDFFATIGLDPDTPLLRELPRPARTNASAGWKTLEAIRAYHAGAISLPDGHPLPSVLGIQKDQRLPKKAGFEAEAVGGQLGWNLEKGRYLTREQAETCVAAYRDWIQSMNQNLLEKLAEPLGLEAREFTERTFLPDHTHIPPAELRAFYDEWGAKLEKRKSYIRRLIDASL